MNNDINTALLLVKFRQLGPLARDTVIQRIKTHRCGNFVYIAKVDRFETAGCSSSSALMSG